MPNPKQYGAVVNRVAFLALLTKGPKDEKLPFTENFRIWQRYVKSIWDKINGDNTRKSG